MDYIHVQWFLLLNPLYGPISNIQTKTVLNPIENLHLGGFSNFSLKDTLKWYSHINEQKGKQKILKQKRENGIYLDDDEIEDLSNSKLCQLIN